MFKQIIFPAETLVFVCKLHTIPSRNIFRTVLVFWHFRNRKL